MPPPKRGIATPRASLVSAEAVSAGPERSRAVGPVRVQLRCRPLLPRGAHHRTARATQCRVCATPGGIAGALRPRACTPKRDRHPAPRDTPCGVHHVVQTRRPGGHRRETRPIDDPPHTEVSSCPARTAAVRDPDSTGWWTTRSRRAVCLTRRAGNAPGVAPKCTRADLGRPVRARRTRRPDLRSAPRSAPHLQPNRACCCPTRWLPTRHRLECAAGAARVVRSPQGPAPTPARAVVAA